MNHVCILLAEELEGFLIAHGHSKLLTEKLAQGILKTSQPFKLARKLTDIAKKKGYVKKRVVDATNLAEVRLPPLDATSSSSEGEIIPPKKNRKFEEPNHDDGEKQNGQDPQNGEPNHDVVEQENGQDPQIQDSNHNENGEPNHDVVEHENDQDPQIQDSNRNENGEPNHDVVEHANDQDPQIQDSNRNENGEPNHDVVEHENDQDPQIQDSNRNENGEPNHEQQNGQHQNKEVKQEMKQEIKEELKPDMSVKKEEEKLEKKVEMKQMKVEQRIENKTEKKEDADNTLPDLDVQLKIQDVRSLQPEEQEMNHEQKGKNDQVQQEPLDLVVSGVQRKRKGTQQLPVDLSTAPKQDKVDLVYRKHNNRWAAKNTYSTQQPSFLNPVLGTNVVDVSAMAHNITLSWIQGKTQSR